MDITPLIKQGAQVIQSYGEKGFRIDGSFYETPVIVFPEETLKWGNTARAVSDLKIADFEILIARAGEIDVVLLGCGAKMALLPPDLKKALKEKGLSVETMDTGAACRTYNVLMAEGRRVAAALFPL